MRVGLAREPRMRLGHQQPGLPQRLLLPSAFVDQAPLVRASAARYCWHQCQFHTTNRHLHTAQPTALSSVLPLLKKAANCRVSPDFPLTGPLHRPALLVRLPHHLVKAFAGVLQRHHNRKGRRYRPARDSVGAPRPKSTCASSPPRPSTPSRMSKRSGSLLRSVRTKRLNRVVAIGEAAAALNGRPVTAGVEATWELCEWGGRPVDREASTAREAKRLAHTAQGRRASVSSTKSGRPNCAQES